MKKKIAVVFAAMLMLVFALTACGSKKDPIVGSWKATQVKASGIEITLEEFGEMTGQELEMSLDFTADGKLTTDVAGTSADGEWKAKEGGKYDVTIEGDTQEMAYEDGKLAIEIEGATMIFEKQ